MSPSNWLIVSLLILSFFCPQGWSAPGGTEDPAENPEKSIQIAAEALRSRNTVKTLAVLSGVKNVDQRLSDGLTLLGLSFLYRDKAAYLALLERGASPNLSANSLPYRGHQLLAAVSGEVDGFWLQKALEHGGNVEVVGDYLGWTPIFFAVSSGVASNVDLLIRAGANLRLVDTLGYTPLLLAVRNRQFDIASRLVDGGGDINVKSRTGKSVLDYLAEYRKSKAYVDNLTARGPFDRLTERISGMNPALADQSKL